VYARALPAGLVVWLRLAEEYIAIRVVAYIYRLFPYLRNGLLLLTGGLLVLLAALLTGLVCWFFLGSWSSTVNVLLSIPFSIIGTFLVLYIFGFTLNTFTLLALSLAVGVVVDDAIMVLENMIRHKEMGKPRRRAALDGATEITFAAMAATFSIVAIFLPVAFMDGVIGRYFSQFVSHLEILQEYLKKKKISYQYLDGQTPLATRQKRIEAFQGGEGDLFLISLKAGGVGLNLTAADYVIHMDPWWNPAVEDQATDRAHRIGQEKPVTVYSLVAENTIEDKILRLHEHKRDLADSLLAGTDMSAKLSADDLLALIAEK
jgi:hypothetical protein